jgi:uncharacterized damage-inducible protein DinB
MCARATDLADRLVAANAAVIEAVENSSDADWQRVTSSEGWTVGVTARHIAVSHVPIMGLVELVATGGEVPPITIEMFHAGNAQHAQEHASCTREEVLEILRRDGKAAADKLRGLSDEQLDNAAELPLLGGRRLSAAEIVETGLIGHPRSHLESIRAAL